jgi:CheY-like chemotaxis protein
LLAGARILLIDDDEDSRLLIGRLLEDLACRPRLAASGAEGLRSAAIEKPDIILLDLLMPAPDGFEILGRLKADASLAGIPVIVVSSVADQLEARQRTLGQVQAFVPKGERFERELRKALIAARIKTFELTGPAG